MKAITIEIEYLDVNNQSRDFVTFKNMLLKTAITKLLKNHPSVLIIKTECNYYN